MNWIENLLSRNLVHAIGWTFLHSLWQGTIIALLLALGFFALQRRTARLRYRVAFSALLLMLVSSLTTFFLLYDPNGSQQKPTRLVILGDVRLVVEKSNFMQEMMTKFGNYFEGHLPVIVTVWLLGVFFFLIRLLGGMAYVRRMRVYGLLPVAGHWQQKVDGLAATLGLRKAISLAESSLTKAPLMIGFIKPLILLPVGTMNHLSTEEVEAILAHEIAHIARQDYIFNILQSLIEIIYYYHPAAWWISAVVRTEREHCCDDTAIRLCSNPLVYAKALLHVQELQRYHTPVLAMAFSGNRNQLLYRIQRILNQSHNKSRTMEKFIATCALLCLLAVLTYGSNGKEATPPPADMKTVIIASVPDTVPGADKNAATKKTKDVELIMEDGKIQSLKIDGETIPQQDYPKYQNLTEGIIEDAEPPAPPSPPSPPSVRGFPAPPSPPAAPSVRGYPAPASPPPPPSPAGMPPPPPPAPGAFGYFHGNVSGGLNFEGDHISYHKTDDGRTVIVIDSDGGEGPADIRVENGVVFLNGEALKGADAPEGMSYSFNNGAYPEVRALGDGNVFGYQLGAELAPLANMDLYQDDLKARIKELEQLRRQQKKAGKAGREAREEMLRAQKIMMEGEYDRMRNQAVRARDEALHMVEGRYLENDIALNAEARKELEEAFERNRETIAGMTEDARMAYEEALRQHEMAISNADAISPEAAMAEMPEMADMAEMAAMPERDFSKILEENLTVDGFMKKGSAYRFSLTAKGLSINGQKQPAEVFEKYKSIYEEVTGETMCGDCSFEVAKSGSGTAKTVKGI